MNNQKLKLKHRYFIEYELKSRKTPQEIIDSWNTEIHGRKAPSIQSIYSIRRLLDSGKSVEPKKTGPRTKTVLTQEKLKQIEKQIERNDFIDY